MACAGLTLSILSQHSLPLSVQSQHSLSTLPAPSYSPSTYSGDLEELALPDASYSEFYIPRHEIGLVRRGRNPFPVLPP